MDYYDSYAGEASFLQETVDKAGKIISPSEKVDLDGDQIVDNVMILVHHEANFAAETLYFIHIKQIVREI